MPDGPCSRSPSLGSQEGELIDQIIRQELHDSLINESDYLLRNSITPKLHPALTTWDKNTTGVWQ